MKEMIEKIIQRSLDEVNDLLERKIQSPKDDQTPLYGREGVLDSLSLVNLIVSIEGSIESEIGMSVILANEKAMSQHNSPFATIGSLTRYVTDIVQHEANHDS